MPYLASLVTGLLLFASDHPLRAWWLQFVAFVPWWLALAAQRRAGRHLWPLGACLAFGYAAPLLVVLGSAPPIVAAAAAAVLEWMLVAMVAGRLVVRGPVLGALAAACAVTLLEIVSWHAIPLFGTAQCFARPLGHVPSVIAFIAWTGVGGLVFASTAVQALVGNAFAARRAAPLMVAAGIVGAVVVADVARWNRQLGEPLRVGAYGWHEATGETGSTRLLDRVLAEAKTAGSRLVVTPETGFGTGENVARKITEFGGLAKKHGLAVALGVWHSPARDNRIWFFGDDGALAAEYRKTHLIPWLEDYAAGDGTLAHGSVGETPFGGMICQDDNFTGVARGYGRDATALLAVPTNDWPAIRFAHFDNSRFRAIENGYAIVRATSNGISAIVSPRGEVLASCDHTEHGPRLLVGDVPLGDGRVTAYADLGDWPMLVLSVLGIAVACWRRPQETIDPRFAA
ncbi:MAG TPA: nitrilase-related carbon-nitrogen hydrolase [Planctomycetota bacterium]